MTVRPFDPARDSYESLAALNPFPEPAQKALAELYRHRAFVPENILVADDNGELIGVVHVFDAGLPYVILDGLYVKPAFRNLELALQLLQAVETEMTRRGVPFYTVHARPQLANALTRYGFRPVSTTPLTLLIKATQE